MVLYLEYLLIFLILTPFLKASDYEPALKNSSNIVIVHKLGVELSKLLNKIFSLLTNYIKYQQKYSWPVVYKSQER